MSGEFCATGFWWHRRWRSIKRYRVVLERAERLAEQSVCGQCAVHGVLRLVASRPGEGASGVSPEEEVLTVECRKCAHQWTMASGT